MNITDTNIAELEFGAIYLDRDAGNHPEDGGALISQDWYVVATAPDGSRWIRYMGTYGWDFDIDDDGYPHVFRQVLIPTQDDDGLEPRPDLTCRDLEEATAALAYLLGAAASPRLNPDVWAEWVPVYGSDCYERESWEELTAYGEREAERWG